MPTAFPFAVREPAAAAFLTAMAAMTALVPLQALAQFELPKPAATDAVASVAQAPTRLNYEYKYGAEGPFTYRANKDLDSGLRDNSLTVKGKIFGKLIYRPTDWLTTLLELQLDREYAIREEDPVLLPSGDLQLAKKREPSLVVEQAVLTLRNVIAPFEVNLGRRGYEDDRHWLFDGPIDALSVSFRHENWRGEAMVGRDVLWSLDLLKKAEKRRTEMAMLYVDYRGFDDHTVSGYLIKRNDLAGDEGKPVTLGFRARGRPTPVFSYWSELNLLRGSDGPGKAFRARAFEAGGTYRFAELPMDPNLTLAYAHGSGAGNAGDGVNTEFRQTGLHSNEARYIGFGAFKTFGEVIDPELSNLKIFTVGVGARVTPGISLDLVYHRYQLGVVASQVRNWGLTAQMNTLADLQSLDVGQELDFVMCFRGMFGLNRLGLDLRAGWFFPGKAFRTSDGGSSFRRADNAVAVVAKFRY